MKFNIPRLVIEVFQYSWYRGRRGVVIEDIPDTRAIGFNDNISSVRIYKGPGYAPGASQKALFFEDRDFKGRRLALGTWVLPVASPVFVQLWRCDLLHRCSVGEPLGRSRLGRRAGGD